MAGIIAPSGGRDRARKAAAPEKIAPHETLEANPDSEHVGLCPPRCSSFEGGGRHIGPVEQLKGRALPRRRGVQIQAALPIKTEEQPDEAGAPVRDEVAGHDVLSQRAIPERPLQIQLHHHRAANATSRIIIIERRGGGARYEDAPGLAQEQGHRFVGGRKGDGAAQLAAGIDEAAVRKGVQG